MACLARARFFLVQVGHRAGIVRPVPEPEDSLSRYVSGLAVALRAGAVLGGLALSGPAAAEPGVTPIRFAPGTSSAEISGGVERGRADHATARHGG
jgi:hypothetical protein